MSDVSNLPSKKESRTGRIDFPLFVATPRSVRLRDPTSVVPMLDDLVIPDHLAFLERARTTGNVEMYRARLLYPTDQDRNRAFYRRYGAEMLARQRSDLNTVRNSVFRRNFSRRHIAAWLRHFSLFTEVYADGRSEGAAGDTAEWDFHDKRVRFCQTVVAQLLDSIGQTLRQEQSEESVPREGSPVALKQGRSSSDSWTLVLHDSDVLLWPYIPWAMKALFSVDQPSALAITRLIDSRGTAVIATGSRRACERRTVELRRYGLGVHMEAAS
jgi:ATP-dependent Clp protease adapter protein ClpS